MQVACCAPYLLSLTVRQQCDSIWLSPGNGGCSTYRYGAVNSGWCVSDLACESCARSCETECAVAGVSTDTQVVLHHKYGTASQPPSIACSGTCPCTVSTQHQWDDSGFVTGAVGMFADGSATEDYPSLSQCQWLISAASDIFLRFTEFDIESGYDFVEINSCTSPNCADTQQIALLTGASVSPSRQFTSSTGFMQIRFRSDDQVSRPGFEAQVHFAELALQPVPYRYEGSKSGDVIHLQQCLQGLSEATRRGLAGGSAPVSSPACCLRRDCDLA